MTIIELTVFNPLFGLSGLNALVMVYCAALYFVSLGNVT